VTFNHGERAVGTVHAAANAVVAAFGGIAVDGRIVHSKWNYFI
jgi:hypothetical protein